MLQIQHTPKLETEEINVTPLLRFFKNVYLVESGVSLDGEIILMLLFVFNFKGENYEKDIFNLVFCFFL